MTELEDDEVVLRFLHTADWHLGRRFPAFSEPDRIRLSRARLDGIDKILGLAKQHSVNAVLCAGDLFDEPDPGKEWWEPLAEKLARHKSTAPIFLLPGNHDPLEAGSVYEAHHPFRRALPAWVHVVDRSPFEYQLTPEAVLFASPCRSRAGQEDPTLSLPPRQPGDTRIRIGLVHGNTFDIDGYQSNFPIAQGAASSRGLDYLAIGDHHSFREVPPTGGAPTVYPGTHEPMSFGEPYAGTVTVVAVDRHRRARLHKESVANWIWEEVTCRSLEELTLLRDSKDRKAHVVRLKLEARVPAHEHEAMEKIVRELQGTEAVIGRVGILQLDRSQLELDTANIEAAMRDLPEVLRICVERLKGLEGGEQDEVARRALLHLFRALQESH